MYQQIWIINFFIETKDHENDTNIRKFPIFRILCWPVNLNLWMIRIFWIFEKFAWIFEFSNDQLFEFIWQRWIRILWIFDYFKYYNFRMNQPFQYFWRWIRICIRILESFEYSNFSNLSDYGEFEFRIVSYLKMIPISTSR